MNYSIKNSILLSFILLAVTPCQGVTDSHQEADKEILNILNNSSILTDNGIQNAMELIKNRDASDPADEETKTLLYYAISFDKFELVKYLLKINKKEINKKEINKIDIDSDNYHTRLTLSLYEKKQEIAAWIIRESLSNMKENDFIDFIDSYTNYGDAAGIDKIKNGNKFKKIFDLIKSTKNEGTNWGSIKSGIINFINSKFGFEEEEENDNLEEDENENVLIQNLEENKNENALIDNPGKEENNNPKGDEINKALIDNLEEDKIDNALIKNPKENKNNNLGKDENNNSNDELKEKNWIEKNQKLTIIVILIIIFGVVSGIYYLKPQKKRKKRKRRKKSSSSP